MSDLIARSLALSAKGGTVNVKDFGAKGDGVTDDSSAFASAISSIPNGGVMVLPANGVFRVSGISSSGKSITILGNGAKLIQNSDANIFNFYGGWDFSVGVSQIATQTIDLSGSGTLSTVSVVTLSTQPPQPLDVGDVVKIYSDDLIPNAAQTGTGGLAKRVGEFAVVALVSDNTVYLTSQLRETYTTNVRLARLSDVSFTLRDLVLDTDPSGDTAGWTSHLIKLTAAKGVRVSNVKCLNGYNSMFLLTSLYDYEFDGIEARNLRNDPSKGRYGYGICDTAGRFGKVTNSSFAPRNRL